MTSFATSCLGIADAESVEEAVAYFKADFPDISLSAPESIKGRHLVIRDTLGAWLVFQVEPAEADAILAKGFRSCPREEFEEGSKGSNNPSWWIASADGLDCFKSEGWRKDMNHSVALIGFDRKRSLMYFMHEAFD
ncbi:MAG: hypothetical protein EOP87_19550 [Verrucomicrobiaceae bacterium]|nr:MAG: hypothetical protein EOP87_19550 [Verrucomicrobiaceae bacterium]